MGTAFPADACTVEQVLPRVAEADADRLAAALLQGELCSRAVSARRLDGILQRIETTPVPVGQSRAHEAVPPLRVILSRAWAAVGEGRRAAECLHVPNVGSPIVDGFMSAARLDVIRQFRLALPDYLQSTPCPGRLAVAHDPQAGAARALLGSAPVDIPSGFADVTQAHLWWCSVVLVGNEVLDHMAVARSLAAVQEIGSRQGLGSEEWVPVLGDLYSPHSSYAELCYGLDVIELFRICGRWIPSIEESVRNFSARAWWWDHPHEPENAARLALRHMALADMDKNLSALDWLHEVVGRRRMAGLALEEGELLQCRLPEPAMFLFRGAGFWFEELDDAFGAFRAAVLCRLLEPSERISGVTDLRLHRLYDGLSCQAGELPSWDQVMEAARSGDNLDILSHVTWEGWLRRLAAALAVGADSIEPRAAMDRLIGSPVESAPFELRRAAMSIASVEPVRRTRRQGSARPRSGRAMWRPVHAIEAEVRGELAPPGVLPRHAVLYLRIIRAPSWLPGSDRRVAYRFDELILPPQLPEPREQDLMVALRQVRRRRRLIPVVLRVAQPLARVPWEVILSRCSGDALAVRRVSPYQGRRLPIPEGGGRWVLHAPSWCSGQLLSALAGAVVEVMHRVDYSALGDANVLVLCGVPTVDTSPPQLTVLEAHQEEDSGDVGTARVVIGLHQLQLRRRSLVLLIEEPTGLLQRSPSSRRTTALMRGIAADMIAAGGHAIVLFPGMPLDLSIAALTAFGEALAECGDIPSGARAATEAILRTAEIPGQSASEARTREELAHEISIFLRPQGA